MNIIIIGGFLGSGKTTAILSLARYLVRITTAERPLSEGDGSTPVVILENEIGEVGVDDAVLRGAGLQVSNLFAGCACCTASGEMTSSAYQIREEIGPEWLIIETTGVATPSLIRENLQHALGLNPSIAVVADASRWHRLMFAMEGLLSAQISESDAVLLNKCEIADDEHIAEAEEDVKSFGCETIFRVSASSGISDDIWEAIIHAA